MLPWVDMMLQFSIAFTSNFTCYFLIWRFFHVFVSFRGFRDFFFSLSAVQGFCLCFHLKIFHSTIAICYHSQFYMSIIYSSHYILILGFCCCCWEGLNTIARVDELSVIHTKPRVIRTVSKKVMYQFLSFSLLPKNEKFV